MKNFTAVVVVVALIGAGVFFLLSGEEIDFGVVGLQGQVVERVEAEPLRLNSGVIEDGEEVVRMGEMTPGTGVVVADMSFFVKNNPKLSQRRAK